VCQEGGANRSFRIPTRALHHVARVGILHDLLFQRLQIFVREAQSLPFGDKSRHLPEGHLH
jgi:hypothetical protein